MDLKDIPKIYSIHDIVPGLRGKKTGLCPLPQHVHSNNTPSFSVYQHGGKEFFKCHGNCNLQGDVIDLIGFMNIPDYKQYNAAMYLRAATILTNGKFEPSYPKIEKDRQRLPSWLWEEMLPPTKRIMQYALQRGLTPAIVEKFKIGTPRSKHGYADTWMAIPTFHLGQLMGIKLRNTGRGMRYINVKGSQKGLFNHDEVYQSTGTIMVLKGEIAVMVADRFGFLACAPTAGEGSYINDIKPAFALANKIVVVGDNDRDPGIREKTREMAERRAALLGADLYFPPEEYKDIDEWLLKDKTAVHQVKEWL